MPSRTLALRDPADPLRSAADRLLDQSLDLVFVAGFDGRIVHVNPRIANFFGYTSDEILAMSLDELVYAEDRVITTGVFQQLVAGQASNGLEVRVRTKDGGHKWILWNGVPSVADQLIFATGQDITERKRIEDVLRESEERFALIANTTKEAVWDWDLRTDRLWRNEAYLQTFGVPDGNAESTIEWWRKRIHPDDVERVWAQLPPPQIEGRQSWLLEYRFRRRDGTYAQVLDRGFVIIDRDGKPTRMVGSVIDISQLQHAEERLRESEERFRLAAKAARDAVWDWDLRQDKVWRSEGFQTLFGYTAEMIAPDTPWWLERVHPDDRDRVSEVLPSCGTLPPAQYAIEYRFRRADGSYADVFDRGFVMFDSEGHPVRMVGSLMDMSERRRAEELAQLQQAEMAHIARISTMGEVATGLAHELNQPLAAIANYAESCVQAIRATLPAAGSAMQPDVSALPPTTAKLLEWVEKIAANTHRAGEIIRRLRNFTRKSDSRRSTVAVDELVTDVVDLMEAETRRRRMRVVWQAQPCAEVIADAVQIQQVLINLLHNAFEAMADNPDDQRQVTISVHADARVVTVSVADVGSGIVVEHRDRVFEAFFTSKANGMGIGLAISRSIVEDHGGRLWFNANSERGVTFHFALPISGVPHDRVAVSHSR
jgi:PAS domain S-box-containing protein